MTLREIIYDVVEHLNAYSDDTNIADEHIAFIVKNKRNLLLKQYMSNLRKEIPQEAIQTICMSLEIDQNCFEDINVLKSTAKIPATLDNTGRSNIIKAYGGTRFQKNINIIDYSRIPLVAAEQYNETQLFVAVDPRSYLVVYNSAESHLLLEQLELEGVFESPEEAYALTCESNIICDESTTSRGNPDDCIPCDFYDVQYPIESALVDPLVMQIVQELLIKYKVPLDELNNTEDDSIASAVTNNANRNRRTRR